MWPQNDIDHVRRSNYIAMTYHCQPLICYDVDTAEETSSLVTDDSFQDRTNFVFTDDMNGENSGNYFTFHGEYVKLEP